MIYCIFSYLIITIGSTLAKFSSVLIYLPWWTWSIMTSTFCMTSVIVETAGVRIYKSFSIVSNYWIHTVFFFKTTYLTILVLCLSSITNLLPYGKSLMTLFLKGKPETYGNFWSTFSLASLTSLSGTFSWGLGSAYLPSLSSWGSATSVWPQKLSSLLSLNSSAWK